MTKINSKIVISINILLIFSIFFFNSYLNVYVDGAPWNGKIETILITCFIPINLIFNYKFIDSKKFILIFFILLVCNFSSNFLYSKKGIYFDSFADIKKEILIDKLKKFLIKEEIINNKNNELISKINVKLSNDQYINNINLNRTYDTFWNKKHTSRISKHLINKHNFPLDWTRGINQDRWNSLNVEFKIAGYLKLYKNEVIIIESKGLQNINDVNNINSRVIFIEDLYKYKNIKLNTNYISLDKKDINLNKYSLNYSSNTWSFIPYIYNYETKKIKNAFEINRLSVKKNDLIQSRIINNIYLTTLFLCELCFIFILILWFFNTIHNLKRKVFYNSSKYIDWFYIFIFFSIPITTFYLFEKIDFLIFNIKDAVNTFQLSIAIIIQIILIFFLIKRDKIDTNHIINTALLLILIPSIFYIAYVFSNNINNIQNFPFTNTQQDDWTIYHLISRLISLGDFETSRLCLQKFYNFSNNNWLVYINIEEVRSIICEPNSLANIYFHNPLYRYVLTIYFILFGQGSFILKITDFWSVFFISIMLMKMIYKSKINNNFIFLILLLYLFINFAGPYRYLIGRGKEEFLSIFLIFTSIYVFLYCNKNYLNFCLVCFISILTLFLRIDYIFLILSIIFFYFEPFSNDIRQINYKRIFKNMKIISIFSIFILSSLLLLVFRSYLFTGSFYPIHPSQFSLATNNANALTSIFLNWVNHLNYIFSTGNGFPNDFRFPSLFLISGSFALIILFFKKAESNILFLPYSISICMISIILSFLFFQTSAYPPRGSIHILPFSLIGFTVIINFLSQYKSK